MENYGSVLNKPPDVRGEILITEDLCTDEKHIFTEFTRMAAVVKSVYNGFQGREKRIIWTEGERLLHMDAFDAAGHRNRQDVDIINCFCNRPVPLKISFRLWCNHRICADCENRICRIQGKPIGYCLICDSEWPLEQA